ncbi:MAG: hypothetical protein CL609_15465 [Anaerolineaceae bacterium]|nr:hypothetical protein [Anaerolineaceae bacterium]
MKIRKLPILLLLFIVLFIPTSISSAQTPTPPQGNESWNGKVLGAIINETAGANVPDNLELMLHAWDEHNTDKLMLHGKSTSDGTYSFEDVSFEPGLIYAVMANYNDAMYFSESKQAVSGQTSIQLDIPIYEETNDLSNAQIDQLHVLFYNDQYGVEVSEVYVLSNLGDKTIKDALQLEDGTNVTVKFPLPEDATNVSFKGDNGGRFLQFPNGFADTAPLVPGEQRSRVMVTFLLPEKTNHSFSYRAPIPIGSMSFLLPKDSGVSLEGEGVALSGVWPMQNGENFSVYSHDALKAGESLQLLLKIDGDLGNKKFPDSESRNFDVGIGLAGLILGIALLFVGWWISKHPGKKDLPITKSFDDLITEIAVLDYAFDRGEIENDDYVNRRLELQQMAKAAKSGKED